MGFDISKHADNVQIPAEKRKIGGVKQDDWHCRLFSQPLGVDLQPARPGCSWDGCAPACKNTDFGGPPWSHSQQDQRTLSRTTVIETAHNVLGNGSLLVLAQHHSSSLKTDHVKYQPAPWLPAGAKPVMSSHKSLWNRRGKYTLHPGKKRAGNEITEWHFIKVRMSGALLWFSSSIEPKAKKRTFTLQPLWILPSPTLSVWSAGPCLLLTLLPLKLGADYSNSVHLCCP